MSCTVMEAAKGMLYCFSLQEFKPDPILCVGGGRFESHQSSQLDALVNPCILSLWS